MNNLNGYMFAVISRVGPDIERTPGYDLFILVHSLHEINQIFQQKRGATLGIHRWKQYLLGWNGGYTKNFSNTESKIGLKLNKIIQYSDPFIVKIIASEQEHNWSKLPISRVKLKLNWTQKDQTAFSSLMFS